MKFDDGKLRYTLIPPSSLKEIAKVLEFGAQKYAAHSWATVPNALERYTDALYRHLEAWRSGETNDPESGLHHLSHAACNAVFIVHLALDKSDLIMAKTEGKP